MFCSKQEFRLLAEAAFSTSENDVCKINRIASHANDLCKNRLHEIIVI